MAYVKSGSTVINRFCSYGGYDIPVIELNFLKLQKINTKLSSLKLKNGRVFIEDSDLALRVWKACGDPRFLDNIY